MIEYIEKDSELEIKIMFIQTEEASKFILAVKEENDIGTYWRYIHNRHTLVRHSECDPERIANLLKIKFEEKKISYIIRVR